MYDEDPSDDDPNFDSYFVRKYCHHQLPTFVVYFPIVLLSIAAVLVVIDRPFVSHLFKSGNIDEVNFIPISGGREPRKFRPEAGIFGIFLIMVKAKDNYDF